MEENNTRMPDEEVQKLISVAEGGIKRKTLFFRPVYYGLREQLEAVAKLGHSGNHLALDYLRKLNEEEFFIFSTVKPPTDTGISRHPHAKDHLGDVLHYYIVDAQHPERDIHPPEYYGAKQILAHSLFELERALGYGSQTER